jgi:hypothetical protein
MAVVGHNWIQGQLKMKVEWNTKQSLCWEELFDMKEDHPQMTARCLVDAEVTTGSQQGNQMQAWATKKTLQDISRMARRMAKLSDFHLDERKRHAPLGTLSSRATRRKRRNATQSRNLNMKCRSQETSSNTQQSLTGSMATLKALPDLECFDFKDPDHKCGPKHQKTTLTVIFVVKQDLCHKARLVEGGHLVNLLDHDVCSSVAKGA